MIISSPSRPSPRHALAITPPPPAAQDSLSGSCSVTMIVTLMPQMQACTGFEEGECMAIKVNAFSLFGARVRMSIYDLSKGQVRSYALSRSQLRSMAALPSSAPACEKWH
ncbi:hypothetical protein AB1Y20_020670 [Prymnesium parvum]|uniref:Uncharacterized protein n=1 Tax=Prymnesium parvum TaxID=97485 RepID=A0AB34JYS7_PRYPA